MKKISFMIIALCVTASAVAQSVVLNSDGRDAAYVKTIVARSEKNIQSLNLTGEKFEAVRNIVANRYFELNDIYESEDKAMRDSKLYRSHFAMPAQLSLYLTQEQIIAVKDAITYNKVKVTYEAYLDEIPTLKEEEKAQIYAWMVEARELALDAGNSKGKHEIFNKYKGRVNNYLSKRGYDLNKEREAWFKRIEERKKNAKK
ncbi:MAG: DUF3826 domain-containing protein [Bacteroidales bacterium]|nr:DUF3826 domain-containing protein [Bacteroidales bacterium]MCM1147167.1 DUF3826 domain-containing protein [Bacteroidales bacterium]MCM1205393.1 DUF3826 domain-containing protein [Bacillota bacterium]MCM1509802.1 DUF3826 domain-containing protein [Clostridium sp.]